MTRLDPFLLHERVEAGEFRKISPSLLNDADICLRRAAEKMKHPVFTASESTLIGNGYHAGLEMYYQWREAHQDSVGDGIEVVVNWPLPSSWVLECCYWAAHAEIYNRLTQVDTEDTPFQFETSFDQIVTKAQQLIHQYFAQGAFWPAQYRILGVETQYLMPSAVDGWVEKGFIDLIVYDAETEQTILDDHKTAGKKWKKGKESPRGNNQPAMYDYNWERATGVKPDAFSFSVMTYDGFFERRIVPITEEDRQLVAAKERTILPLLVAAVEGGLELPGNTSSFLCAPKWCDFWVSCPFGGGTN